MAGDYLCKAYFYVYNNRFTYPWFSKLTELQASDRL